jgi:hypothetical protein
VCWPLFFFLQGEKGDEESPCFLCFSSFFLLSFFFFLLLPLFLSFFFLLCFFLSLFLCFFLLSFLLVSSCFFFFLVSSSLFVSSPSFFSLPRTWTEEGRLGRREDGLLNWGNTIRKNKQRSDERTTFVQANNVKQQCLNVQRSDAVQTDNGEDEKQMGEDVWDVWDVWDVCVGCVECA